MNHLRSKSLRTVGSTPGKQSGFTLIELMIASVIGLVLLSGVVTIFSSNNASTRISNGMIRLQDSGRVALDILSYSARMTGYEGCRSETKNAIQVLATNAPAVNFPDNAIWGSEVDAAGDWNPDISENRLNGIADKVKADTDVLYLQHGNGRTTNLQADMASSGDTISLPENPDLIVGDLVLISDCETANIIRATGVGTATNTAIAHDTTGNSQSNLTKAFVGTGVKDLVTLRVMRFDSKAYFVGDSGRDMPNGDDIFSLWELDTNLNEATPKPVELIEGVEDFQVLYGLQPDREGAPAAINYVTADNVTDPGLIVSLQIGLLISTTDYAAQSNDTQTYNVAGRTVGPPGSTTDTQHGGDRRLRAAFNTTIQIRNRML